MINVRDNREISYAGGFHRDNSILTGYAWSTYATTHCDIVETRLASQKVAIFSMTNIPFLAIDHVQLAMPPGGEEKARQFFDNLLGMVEVPKPAELAKRGGCWFRSGNVEIHLGVENDFRPAVKAHPALLCRDYDALVGKLTASAVAVKEDTAIPGVRRSHILDPFGNRIELIALGS